MTKVNHALLTLRAIWLAERLRHAIARRRWNTKRMAAERTGFYQRVWREAAETFDATAQARPDGSLTIRLDSRMVVVDRTDTSLDDVATLRLAGNKPLVAKRLVERHLPIPAWRQFSLTSIAEATHFMQTGRTYVVKPARDTGGGLGVTTNVRSHRDLIWAAARAAVFGTELCIEEQIEGDNYRLLYLDGMLLDAVRRGPPTVTGDGQTTIHELVSRTNQQRLAAGADAAQTLLNCDLEMRQTLARQGLAPSSIPPAGRTVRLKTVINDNAAQENLPATHLLCDAVIEAGARAAAAVGVKLAGIDIITRDPSRPLQEVGGVILEVNTTPGLYCHYHRRGEPKPVANDILGHLLGRRNHVCRV